MKDRNINKIVEKQKELGEDVLRLIDKTEQIEQMIINVDAKYKIKFKEINRTII